ncbi:MAG: TolC family protein [Terriglobia bacterium]
MRARLEFLKPLFFFLVTICLLPTATIAEDQEVKSREIPFELVGIDTGHERKISLQESIELALRNSPGVKVEQANTEIARLAIKAAQGHYDPNLGVGPRYQSQTVPVGSLLGGGLNGAVSTDTAAWDVTWKQLFSSGGNVSVLFDSNRLATNNLFTNLSPQYNTFLSFNFTQPLLRDLKIDPVRREIRIAKNQSDLSDVQFRMKVIDTVTAVVSAYWVLHYTYSDMEVKRETVQWARDQLETNKRLAAAGSLPKVQIAEAEAELERRKGDLLLTMDEVNRAENVFKQLILPDRSDPLWKENLRPSDLAELRTVGMEFSEAVQRAMSGRPELVQLNLQSKANQIDRSFFESEAKPQLDLVASYLSTGLAGTFFVQPNFFNQQTAVIFDRLNELSSIAGLPPVFPPTGTVGLPENFLGGYGTSLENLFAQRYRTVQVGVQLNFPIRNRTAQANLARTKVVGRQIEYLRQQTEQAIEADVRNSLQGAISARERVGVARAGREASQIQLESEERRFRVGATTSFFVFTRQNQLSEAKSREIRTLAEFNVALTQLYRATADTLQIFNVQLTK